MTFEECIQRRNRLLQLIKLENTGNSIELSKKQHCSRSTLMRDLEFLRSNNFSIAYDRYKRTFYFDKALELPKSFYPDINLTN